MPLLRSLACSALAALAIPVVALGQVRVQAQRGVLLGEVRDSLTQRPVAYPLITLAPGLVRAFGNETGRFRFERVGPGPLTVRLQQIGYQPVEVSVLVVDDPAAPIALQLTIARQELQLPEVVVVGDRGACAVPGLAATAGLRPVLDRLRANVDRIRALEQNYPFEITFDHTAARTDSSGEVAGRARRRTFVYSSEELQEYRANRVVDRAGRITLFTVSDVAREEFQRHHCFWYEGADTVDGGVQHQITFGPTTRTRSIDWAGSLSIDAETALLKRADVRLTNITDRSPITSTNCVIEYAEIAPTLPLEYSASCWTLNRGREGEIVYDQRRFLSHRFLKRRPGDP